jgi:uncharacterized protein
MDHRNRKWELPLFFLSSYALMCLGVFLYRLTGWHMFSINYFKFGPALIWLLLVFSPTISSFVLTLIFRGKDESKKLFRQYFKFKVKAGWYLAALALLLVPLLISFILNRLGIGGGNGVDPSLTLTSLLSWFVYNFFSGPFAEEAGWRGFALPRLQAKRSSLAASLILGFFWTLWHIPLAFVPGADQAELTWLGWIIYTVLIFTICIILTWLYNNTGGSFVITILAHFCFNIGSNMVTHMFGLVNGMSYNIVGGIAGVLYLIIIFVFFGVKRFSRKPESQIPIIAAN